MAYADCKIKNGMGGSRNGRSRWTTTEDLKVSSKKKRRRLGRKEIREQLCGK